MNDELFTKVYQKAVRENDKDLRRLLDGVSKELSQKSETIKGLKSLVNFSQATTERAKATIALIRKYPNHVVEICSAWDDGYLVDEEDL